MSDFKKLPCTTACDGPQAVPLKDCEGAYLEAGAAVARCSDIPPPESYSLVTVEPTPGDETNPIATINVDGTDFVIEETVTAITGMTYATGTSMLAVTFRDEAGVETVTEVEIPVEVAVEHISPVVIDPANLYPEYADKIVVDANGDFYGFNLAGEPTKLNITETVTTMTGVLTSGNLIGTYTNEDGAAVEIRETITGITATYNPATQSIDIVHTNEDGAQPAIAVDISDLYPDTSITERGLVNLVSLQHLGDGDKLINGVRIGNGGGDLDSNTVVGRNAMYSLSTGVANTGMGFETLRDLTTGYGNTTYGNSAGAKITTGFQNTALGASAMGNTSGTVQRLTAVGNAALYSNTTGTNNVAVGFQALFLNTTGSNNIAMGDSALRNNTTGVQNVAIGSSALVSNTSGGTNLAIGQAAMLTNTTGYNNVALGAYTLFRNTTGYGNSAIGASALYNNTTGFNNMAFGVYSMFANTTGVNNTAVGTNTLRKNTTGNFNTAFGNNTLHENTTAAFNTAMGNNAMFNTTTGQQNTAMGDAALQANNVGSFNVAVGRNALMANISGERNTAVGMAALPANTTGLRNVAIGNFAMGNNTTGSDNTAVGNDALSLNVNYTNTTGIGYNTQVTGSNQVQIGNALTTVYVYGTVQNRSDLRDKTDVTDTVLGLDFINALRPVDYRWDLREDYLPVMPEGLSPEQAELWIANHKLGSVTPDGTKKRMRKHHGIIAQELRALAQTHGFEFGGLQDHSLDGGDDVLSVGYDELIAPLIKAVQELSAKVESLETQLANLS